jgi:hypothetical protein
LIVMTRAGVSLAVLTGLAVAGCVHTDFTRTAAVALPPRSPDCHLEIVFDGPPRRPYVVLGQVWTDSSSPQVLYGRFDTNAAPVQRIIQQACVAGAHGLMSVTVQTHRPWGGKGWKRTQAAAVAFAYVDGSGRVLPPPSGPRVEIPISAFGP